MFAQIGKKEENLERIGEGTDFTRVQEIAFFYKNFKGSTDVFQVKENVHSYISMYLF